MKVKHIWAIFIALSFFGCDDNTEGLGLGMLPDEDKIEVNTQTYKVETQSILSGPVYARTDTAYIGRYKDTQFDTYEASFLTQLNCLDSLLFPKVYDKETKTGVMVEDQTLSTELVLTYNKFFGDSITPNHINIYELNKNISGKDKDIHYTDINVEDYFNRNSGLLGEASFSAADLITSNKDKLEPGYEPQVRVKMPKELGDKILRLNREHEEYFYDRDAFIENVFKGVYAECDQGSGTILYIDRVSLDIKFNYYVLDSIGNILETHDKKDSISVGRMSFVGTKEVYQLNKLNSTESNLKEKVQETKHTYIKSPAGIFTEVTLPLDEIINDKEFKNDTIHSVKLELGSYLNDDSSEFPMEKPRDLLMIPKSEMHSFFESDKIPDNITSYIATINSKGQYIFPNISRLVTSIVKDKEQLKKEDPDWNKMVLIPITLNTTIERDAWGQEKVVIINTRHNLKPQYVKLKGGKDGEEIKLDVIFTSFNNPSFHRK